MNKITTGREPSAVRGLTLIFYIGMASIVNSILNYIPVVPSLLTAWISRGIAAAMIYATYQMTPWNPRYRKASNYRLIMLTCALASAYLLESSLLMLLSSISSLVSVYQEYAAHSELIAAWDTKLSANWNRLFYWSFAAGVLSSFGGLFAAMIAVALNATAVEVTNSTIGAMTLPVLVMDLIYLCYLRRTIVLLNHSEA